MLAKSPLAHGFLYVRQNGTLNALNTVFFGVIVVLQKCYWLIEKMYDKLF